MLRNPPRSADPPSPSAPAAAAELLFLFAQRLSAPAQLCSSCGPCGEGAAKMDPCHTEETEGEIPGLGKAQRRRAGRGCRGGTEGGEEGGGWAIGSSRCRPPGPGAAEASRWRRGKGGGWRGRARPRAPLNPTPPLPRACCRAGPRGLSGVAVPPPAPLPRPRGPPRAGGVGVRSPTR